jgi:hypothetical protein
MTELAIRNNQTDIEQTPPAAPTAYQDSALVQWAYEARQAAQIAASLAKTSFVPASLRGKPDDITAAILAGQELGLRPMATLRSMDVIQGTPALRAHAMRGLVQAHGHSIWQVESTDDKCVMRGHRKGEPDKVQEIEWTIDQARTLGLLGKDQWKKQQKTMLRARATGDICRLVASDVLHAMPYTAEELGDDDQFAGIATSPRITAADIVGAETIAGDAFDDLPAEPATSESPTEAPVEPMTKPQQGRLFALFGEKGLTSPNQQRTFINETLGVAIQSRADLTKDQAVRLIDELDRMPTTPADEPSDDIALPMDAE